MIHPWRQRHETSGEWGLHCGALVVDGISNFAHAQEQTLRQTNKSRDWTCNQRVDQCAEMSRKRNAVFARTTHKEARGLTCPFGRGHTYTCIVVARGSIPSYISSISCRFVLREAVSQTKYCFSLNVIIFGPFLHVCSVLFVRRVARPFKIGSLTRLTRIETARCSTLLELGRAMK